MKCPACAGQIEPGKILLCAACFGALPPKEQHGLKTHFRRVHLIAKGNRAIMENGMRSKLERCCKLAREARGLSPANGLAVVSAS
jgi:hypothetical protein